MLVEIILLNLIGILLDHLIKAEDLQNTHPGTLIAFSTGSGRTAPDGEGENSIYTLSLSRNMMLEQTSIDQVFRNVRTEVLAETNGIKGL